MHSNALIIELELAKNRLFSNPAIFGHICHLKTAQNEGAKLRPRGANLRRTTTVHAVYEKYCTLLTHVFLLVGVEAILAMKRSSSRRIVLRGIYPGCRVMRGHDWNWKDQDGGPGKVLNVCIWRHLCDIKVDTLKSNYLSLENELNEIFLKKYHP